MTTEIAHSTDTPDAELVAQSLAGSRDAFRKIVERHQTLVCSLAYCATGSLSQSEDLAQETFLAAWQQLPGMREPSKLRSWLCAIARFVIGKEIRRRGRQPLHDAEPLETIGELRAPEALPSERAVTNEEEAILWHCVARIPEMYREPLVLFYREHQSVERVAEALGLSRDAVKQRLARGRRLLHKQMLAYVEATLQNTRPGKTFTGAVLAALPPSAFSAKILALGAAAKTSTLKTVAAVAAVGLVILYWSFLGFLVFAGVCAGYWMRRSCASSPGQCQDVIGFWRILARSLALCAVIRELLWPGLLLAACPRIFEFLPQALLPSWYSGQVWRVSQFVLDFPLVVIIADLAMLAWPWRREIASQASQAQESFTILNTRLRRWVLLGMIVPALWLIPTVGEVLGKKLRPPPQHLSHAELQSIVSTRKDAYYDCLEDSGVKTLYVVLPENNPGSIKWRADHMPDWWKHWTRGARPSSWKRWIDSVPGWLIWTMYWIGWSPAQMVAPADEWSLKLLDDAGIHLSYGKMIRTWGDPWPFSRWMPLFILPMGITILSRRNGAQSSTNAWPNSEQPTMENQTGGMVLSLHSDPKARRVFCIAFGTAFALAFTANALTAFGVYVLLLVGALKGTFFGLIAGIGVLYLRSKRKVRMESN
jgi:RNA polymerase sigma factor (sigma-70 family)